MANWREWKLLNQFDGCISRWNTHTHRQETALPSHYPETRQQRCSLLSPFPKSHVIFGMMRVRWFMQQMACHTTAWLTSTEALGNTRGSSSLALARAEESQDRTNLHSVHFPTNNCQKEQNAHQTEELITSTGNGIGAALSLRELNVGCSSPLRCAWNCIEEQLTHAVTYVCLRWHWLLMTSVPRQMTHIKPKNINFGIIVSVMANWCGWKHLNQFDGCISRWNTHTRHSFALTLPRHNATEEQFAFTPSKIASHFRHDESAVTHAANGLSYDCLINKHRDPREHPWILITSRLRDGTDRRSVHFLPFWLITVKSNKTHVGRDLPADPCSFLVL